MAVPISHLTLIAGKTPQPVNSTLKLTSNMKANNANAAERKKNSTRWFAALTQGG